MTDTTTETVGPDTEAEGWGADAQAVAYPEYPKDPHNHRFTISMNGQGPMVVVRGNTAAEVNEAWQELEEHATGAIMGSAWAAFKAAAMLANGLGATPLAAGAPAPVQPVPLPQSPQAQYPVGPPAVPQGPPPAQWQQAGAPPQQGPQNQEYKNAGWYRLDVPFPKKGQFDGICAQYQLRKGRPSEGGQFSFNNKGEKNWYVSPDVAGAFPMFSPVPA